MLIGSKLILSSIVLNNYQYYNSVQISFNPHLLIINIIFSHISILYCIKSYLTKRNYLDIISFTIQIIHHSNYLYKINLYYYILTLLKLFFERKTFFTVISWIIILIVYFIIDSIYLNHLKIKLIIKRKFFHFLSCLIYIPAIYIIPKETFKCIVLIVLYIFIIFEIIRNLPHLDNYYINLISNYLLSNIDKRDDSEIILTHIFLLTGISSSIFYNFKNYNYNYIGILILGIGDSMCSIFGVLFGRNKIYYPTNKTLEGSLAGFLTTCFAFSIIKKELLFFKEIIFMVFIFLYEGFTLEIDNLVLPLFANNIFLNYN